MGVNVGGWDGGILNFIHPSGCVFYYLGFIAQRVTTGHPWHRRAQRGKGHKRVRRALAPTLGGGRGGNLEFHPSDESGYVFYYLCFISQMVAKCHTWDKRAQRRKGDKMVPRAKPHPWGVGGVNLEFCLSTYLPGYILYYLHFNSQRMAKDHSWDRGAQRGKCHERADTSPHWWEGVILNSICPSIYVMYYLCFIL